MNHTQWLSLTLHTPPPTPFLLDLFDDVQPLPLSTPQGTPQGTPQKRNFTIGLTGKVTDRERRLWNDQALETLKNTLSNPGLHEQLVLARYSGEGTIGGSFNEYYTPPELACRIWQVLEDLGVSGHGLDPACGTGVLMQHHPENVNITGVEFSRTSSQIARLLLPECTVHNMTFEGFLLSHPQDTFDFAIMNPPFGPRSIGGTLDRPDVKEASEYFIERVLERVKDHGLVAMVVPYGFLMNKSRRHMRRNILNQAEILAVHGLPASTFMHTGATFSSCDVWFLRTRERKLRTALGQLKEETFLKLMPEDTLKVLDGKYFEMHPEHLHGTHSEKQGPAGRMLYFREGEFSEDLMRHIDVPNEPQASGKPFGYADVLRHLGAMGETHTINQIQFKVRTLGHIQWGETQIREGKLHLYLGHWVPVQEQHLTALRQALALNELLKVQASATSSQVKEAAAMFDQTRRLLTEYLTEHGNPHLNSSIRQVRKHSSAVSALLASIKADGGINEQLFTFPEVPQVSFDPRDLTSVVRHLQAHREPTSTLRIFELQTLHEDELQLARALKQHGFAFDGRMWITEGQYYTGLLQDKIGEIERHLQNEDLSDAEREALQIQQQQVHQHVERRTIEDLDVKPTLGILPVSLVQEYARSLTVLGETAQEVIIERNPDTGLLMVDTSMARSRTRRACNTVKRYLMLTGRKVDEAELYSEWDQGFVPWLIEHGHREEVEDLLNQGIQYLRAHHPTHDVTPLIPGWKSNRTPHWYQNAYVHQALAQGSILLADDVGLGKTLSEILLLLTGKALGYWHKPLMVVPKNLIPKWRREVLMVKPDARICVVGGTVSGETFLEDTSKTSLESQLWEAILGQWDMVFMSRETLARIPLSDHTLTHMLESQFYQQHFEAPHQRPQGMGYGLHRMYARSKVKHMLNQGELSLEEAENAAQKLKDLDVQLLQFKHSDRLTNEQKQDRSKKREERSRTAFIMQGYEALQNQGDKLETVWEDCNFDCIAVDEAHAYVNLWTLDSRENIKYLAPPKESSHRAMDLHYKIKSLYDRFGEESRVHLLTATPLSNSLIDVYNLVSILKPSLWERVHIFNVANFIERYCHIKIERVFNPDKDQWDTRQTLLGIKNLRELRHLTRQVIRRYTAQEAGLKLPDPQLQYQIAETDPLQEQYFQEIFSNTNESLRKYLGSDITEANQDDFRLAVLTLIRRVELDLEMLEPEKHKGYVSPKVRLCLNEIQKRLAEGEKILLVVDHKDMPDPRNRKNPNPMGYSFHQKLQQLILKENPLRPEAVRIINATETPDANSRQEICDLFNDGTLRVVIANSSCMGEGTDFQKDAKNLYRLDVPMNPRWFIQVNGRVYRQGNTSDFVRLVYFLSKRGLDVDTLDLLSGKMNWFNAFWSGDEDYIEVLDNTLIPSREQLLTLAIQDEEERRAEQERVKARTHQERQKAERSKAIKTFHKLQMAHHSKKSITHKDGKAKPSLTAVQKRDVASYQERIRYYEETLRRIDVFQPYQEALTKTAEVLIDPKSGLILQQGQMLIHHTVTHETPHLTVVKVTDLDITRNRVTLCDVSKNHRSGFEFTLSDSHPHHLRTLNGDLVTAQALRSTSFMWSMEHILEHLPFETYQEHLRMHLSPNRPVLVWRNGTLHHLQNPDEWQEGDTALSGHTHSHEQIEVHLNQSENLRHLLRQVEPFETVRFSRWYEDNTTTIENADFGDLVYAVNRHSLIKGAFSNHGYSIGDGWNDHGQVLRVKERH